MFNTLLRTFFFPSICCIHIQEEVEVKEKVCSSFFILPIFLHQLSGDDEGNDNNNINNNAL